MGNDPRFSWVAPRLDDAGNGAADLDRLAGCFDVTRSAAPDCPDDGRPAAERPALTLAHRQFCERQAAAFYAISCDVSGAAWADLAARIQRVLVGEFARFTLLDVALVGALQRATMHGPHLSEAAEVRRNCTALAVLLVEAAAGRLPQLRGRA